MKNHIYKFSFVSYGPKKDDRTFKPFIQLVLDNWTTTKDGLIRIAPDLVSDQEIDAIVAELKSDLDRVATMAKLELEKLNSRNSN